MEEKTAKKQQVARNAVETAWNSLDEAVTLREVVGFVARNHDGEC